MLAAMVMHLQAESSLWPNGDALDLVLGSVFQHGKAAPRPMYSLVETRCGMAAFAQLIDDLFHLLRAFAFGHQHRVTGIDDDQVLDADRGN